MSRAATRRTSTTSGRRHVERTDGAAGLDAATGLIRLYRIVQCIHTRVSEHRGLPPVQAKLLCALVSGPRQMAELARGFGVEKAALTGLVDRAEARGLVQRSAVPGDRRALAVTLTDAGHGAATAFHAEATAELERLLAPIDPDDRERFRRLVAQIIAAAETGPCQVE